MAIKKHLTSLENKLNNVEKELKKAPSWDQVLITKIKRERLIIRDKIRILKEELTKKKVA